MILEEGRFLAYSYSAPGRKPDVSEEEWMPEDEVEVVEDEGLPEDEPKVSKDEWVPES